MHSLGNTLWHFLKTTFIINTTSLKMRVTASFAVTGFQILRASLLGRHSRPDEVAQTHDISEVSNLRGNVDLSCR